MRLILQRDYNDATNRRTFLVDGAYSLLIEDVKRDESTAREHFRPSIGRERLAVSKETLYALRTMKLNGAQCFDNFCKPRVDRSSVDSNVSLSAFAYLYSELVQYHQNRVDSISELERRLESSGYGVGLKVLELLAYRSREVGQK